VSSPVLDSSSGVTTAPRLMAPSTRAMNTPKTRAISSLGSERWSAVTASVSATIVPAPRTTTSANATSGESTRTSNAVGTQ
jgi:hypothetical protein